MNDAHGTIGFTPEVPATAASPFQVAAEILGSAPIQDEGPWGHVALGAAQAWSFVARRQPVRIEVLRGEVMVTFEGDPMDHILAQGAVLTRSARGRVAVAAFRRSRLSVSAA